MASVFANSTLTGNTLQQVDVATTTMDSGQAPNLQFLIICYVIVVAECLLHPLSIIVSALNFRIIFPSAILHPNLKAILLCESVSIIVIDLNRIAMLSIKFYHGDILYRQTPLYLQNISSIAINVRNMFGHVLLAERLLASYLVTRYEQFRKPYFTVTWASLMIIGAPLSLTQTVSFQTSPYLVVMNVLLFALCATECVIFSILSRHNRRKYKQDVAGIGASDLYRLSTRFQRSENVRTSHQLSFALFLHSINVFFTLLSALILFFGGSIPKFISTLFFNLMYIEFSIVEILIEWTVITFHPLLKRQLLAYLARVQLFLGCRRSNQIHFAPQEYTYSNGGGGSPHGTTKRAEKDIPKTINGDRLCIAYEPAVHFKALEEAWNITKEKGNE